MKSNIGLSFLTSWEAKRETTPKGMKITLMTKNVKITCKRGKKNDNFDTVAEKNWRLRIQIYDDARNIKEAYPTRCKNWLASWKLLLCKF